MNYKSYLAELLGTFTLTLVVWFGIAFTMPLSTPVAAAVTLGLFVYTVGSLSGAHLNPAVTIALLTVEKIKPKDAGFYIAAQAVGATLAMLVGANVLSEGVRLGSDVSVLEGLGEIVGSFIFVFGIASVAAKNVSDGARGVVVGGSLLLGIYLATGFTSNGILNPAVAWGIGSFNPMYILGPIIGAVGAVWCYRWLHSR